MGQKVNPHGLRVGIIKNWDSRWFVKGPEFGKTLVSDYNLRKFLKKKLFSAGVPKIEIERDNQRARVIIHCAKPGLVIGRGGDEIEKLRPEIENILGIPVSVNIVEVKYPDMNAQLVAEKIAEQLEKRFSFRRAMKQAMAATMKLGAKGIKVAVSGLLGGADIARTEHYHEGTIPLQTIRADIDYGQHAALTKMGLIGIKVWIYKGEVLTKVNRDAKSEADRSRVGENIPQRRERRYDRSDGGDDKGERSDRPYQPRDNRGGDRRPQGQGGGRGRFNNTPPSPPGNFGNRKSFGPKTARPARSADDETPETAKDDASKGGNGDVNA